MTLINSAREYVFNAVIIPALNSPEVSPKQWVEHCRFVGDIYDYIKRFSGLDDNQYSTVYSELKSLGLTSIEDIIKPFGADFKDYLDEKFDTAKLVIGDRYTSWDIGIIARNFNVQRGISLVENNGQVLEILTKVTIGEGRYPNEWLEADTKLKHYMLSFKNRSDPEFKTNKAIIDSKEIPIHVFIKSGLDCIYNGVFKFVEYFEEVEGAKWFVLQKRNVGDLIYYKDHLEEFDYAVKKSSMLLTVERKKKIESLPEKPVRKLAIIEVYDRNPHVVAAVLERAKGICESCNLPAPFLRSKDLTPFLEVHHRKPLAEDGVDTIENALAVCPNCHRKAHYG